MFDASKMHPKMRMILRALVYFVVPLYLFYLHVEFISLKSELQEQRNLLLEIITDAREIQKQQEILEGTGLLDEQHQRQNSRVSTNTAQRNMENKGATTTTNAHQQQQQQQQQQEFDNGIDRLQAELELVEFVNDNNNNNNANHPKDQDNNISNALLLQNKDSYQKFLYKSNHYEGPTVSVVTRLHDTNEPVMLQEVKVPTQFSTNEMGEEMDLNSFPRVQCYNPEDPNKYLKIWFVHIQKAGGRSLENIFRKLPYLNVTPSPGHNTYKQLNEYHNTWHETNVNRGIKPCFTFVTMLRDPVMRVISEFYSSSGRVLGNKLDLAFDDPRRYDCNFSNCKDTNLKLLLGQKAITLKEFVNYNHTYRSPNNRQVYMMSAIGEENDPVIAHQLDPTLPTPEEVFESAVKALQRMDFIGIAEYFDESSQLLSETLFLNMTEYDSLFNDNAHPARDEFDSDVIDAIIERNKWDYMLYEKAKEIFKAKYTAMVHDLQPKIPLPFQCEKKICGPEVNQQVHSESPKHGYLDVKTKPWNTLCSRLCTRPAMDGFPV